MDPSAPTEQDREHLRLLVVFHWVLAALTALFAFVPVLHLVIGLAMIGTAGRNRPHDEAAPIIGAVFVAVALAMIALGLALAGALALAAHSIRERRRRTFCLVVAGIACLFVPLGTLLGVFTIVVLTRDSVRPLFELRESALRPA